MFPFKPAHPVSCEARSGERQCPLRASQCLSRPLADARIPGSSLHCLIINPALPTIALRILKKNNKGPHLIYKVHALLPRDYN
ncbi:hypothetical protein EVAR_21210_1 [Eumeta japonica]|uniref:Uncharacterized protein n=1 Tax=Eumeta variegata TaxID=151549 RepID=A0A4C1UP29_EUMVA|nr:hypothetical protein EVAR_21210_1 [Eumeta japonica]